MPVNKLGQFITTAVIGGFAVILAGMVIIASGRAANPVQGSLAQVLEGNSAHNLNFVAVSLNDIYGENWTGASIVCPGETADTISEKYAVDAGDLGIEGTVGENENFLLLHKEGGQIFAQHFDTEEVDLCQVQAPAKFDAFSPRSFEKIDGHWVLVG